MESVDSKIHESNMVAKRTYSGKFHYIFNDQCNVFALIDATFYIFNQNKSDLESGPDCYIISNLTSKTHLYCAS